MEYLPAEVQFKILKNLSFDELLIFKQTNRHFYDFIKKYKTSLARKRLKCLYFGSCAELDRELGDFPVYEHLHEKWQYALENKQIPQLCMVTSQSISLNPGHTEPLIALKEFDESFFPIMFDWPLIPKNIKELEFVRCCLLKMLSCDFNCIEFQCSIFNPKMIKLLLDNEEIVKKKFNCQKAVFQFDKNINVWASVFDYLIISEALVVKFEAYRTTDEDESSLNILLELLLNEGYRIPSAIFDWVSDKQIGFYNNLINKLETSKEDLSRMVTKIKFCFQGLNNSGELIVRGVEMSEIINKEKCYKITNIHNSKMMFSIIWNYNKYEDENFVEIFLESIEIARIK